MERVLKETHLEILEIVPLYKFFTPFEFGLRAFYEKILKNFASVGEMSDLFIKNVPNIDGFNLNALTHAFNGLQPINFRRLSKELEVYEVLCSLGPILLVKSNASNQPMLLNINDLIGRKLI